MRAESGPWFSFCFSSLLCSCLCAFIENSLFSNSGPSRFTSGCSCLTVVTTSLSTKTNTATNKASKLAGMQDSLNWRMPKKRKITQSQNLSKRWPGWDRSILRCEGLGAMSPQEGTWSQESQNRRTRARSYTLILYFDQDLAPLFQGAEKIRCSGGLFERPARWRSYLMNGGEGQGLALFLSSPY